MNEYAHLIIIGEWEGFHRKRFIELIVDKFQNWSDTILIQNPLSLTVNLFHRFKPFLRCLSQRLSESTKRRT